MAQTGPEHATGWKPDHSPTDGDDVVVQVTEVLRNYLSTDRGFTPEMAVDRVRIIVNSGAAMKAFVADALRPGQVEADRVIMRLAGVLDQSLPAEVAVLRLIDVVESPEAVRVYDRAAGSPPEPTDNWH